MALILSELPRYVAFPLALRVTSSMNNNHGCYCLISHSMLALAKIPVEKERNCSIKPFLGIQRPETNRRLSSQTCSSTQIMFGSGTSNLHTTTPCVLHISVDMKYVVYNMWHFRGCSAFYCSSIYGTTKKRNK